MVVGAQPQPQPQQQQQQKPPQQPETSPEEEALKRNTDCVYFLASPLTCKKGSECEYRHSEYARVNPRDCWYWLNGNCLNLKCAFRHPPLDGLLGSPVANSTGPSLPLSHTVAAPATHAAFTPSKQAVPCVFFQKGHCLKGDRCAFSHGPNPMTSSKVPLAPATTHVTEPSGLKKVFSGLQKCSQELKVPQASASKSVGVLSEAKPAPKIQTALLRNGVSFERNVPSTKALGDEAFRYKPTSILPVSNGGSIPPNHLLQAHVSEHHGFQNGKDVDEHLRESSPGFDVLVDDELGDSDYYHGEDQFGRARGHEGRNLNSVNEYDLDRPSDYNSMGDVDRERFHDPRGYDPYDHMQGQYAWDQHRASSERLLVAPARLEKRGFSKSDSPENIDELDLRHRLSKHRKVNGMRSVVSHDYALDEDWKNRPRRDSQQLPSRSSREGSNREGSSRLHGRIKLPGGSAAVNGGDLREEREADRGRSRGRLSPRRAQVSSHPGRLRDRIKDRVEDFNNEERNLGAHRSRREMDDRSDDFLRPKRLSELKGGKEAEIKEQSYLGKRKNVMDNHQQSEGDLSFDGPMPLSEILRRKREASGSGKSSVHKQGNNQRESRVSNPGDSETAVTEMKSSVPTVAKEEPKHATADAVGTEDEKVDVAHGQASEGHNVGEVETEEGMIYDEPLEEEAEAEAEAEAEGEGEGEGEGEDQREGEYDYEQGDEGEYYEEGENAEGEEEYMEEEDGDDFAKKIGVMFS